MAEIKWIKLTVNMFDDEKIRLIQAMPEADAIIVIWVRLLTLAGKTNSDGQIYIGENMPYNDEMLATLFNKPVNVIRLAIQTLKSFNMIDVFENGTMFVNNWDKHQNIDGMDKIRLQNAERNKKYREKKKQKQLENKSDVSVTSRDGTELDLELEEELDKESNKKNTSKQDSMDTLFSEIWKLYPKKTMRKEALAAFKKSIKKGTSIDAIKKGVETYVNHLESNKTWLKPMDGGRWFQKERWNDEYDTPKKEVNTYEEQLGF